VLPASGEAVARVSFGWSFTAREQYRCAVAIWGRDYHRSVRP
jgi:hypothetical protein